MSTWRTARQALRMLSFLPVGNGEKLVPFFKTFYILDPEKKSLYKIHRTRKRRIAFSTLSNRRVALSTATSSGIRPSRQFISTIVVKLPRQHNGYQPPDDIKTKTTSGGGAGIERNIRMERKYIPINMADKSRPGLVFHVMAPKKKKKKLYKLTRREIGPTRRVNYSADVRVYFYTQQPNGKLHFWLERLEIPLSPLLRRHIQKKTYKQYMLI